jgi:hypothetical protein
MGPRRAIATRLPVDALRGPEEDVQGFRPVLAPSPTETANPAGRAAAVADAERAYLRRIARTTLLTREAEVDLGERIATGERTIASEALASAPGVRYVPRSASVSSRARCAYATWCGSTRRIPAARTRRAGGSSPVWPGCAPSCALARPHADRSHAPPPRRRVLRTAVADLGLGPRASATS